MHAHFQRWQQGSAWDNKLFTRNLVQVAWSLVELGVRLRLARNTAGSGLGPWYLAKAKALSVGLSNAYFKSLGLPSLVDE